MRGVPLRRGLQPGALRLDGSALPSTRFAAKFDQVHDLGGKRPALVRVRERHRGGGHGQRQRASADPRLFQEDDAGERIGVRRERGVGGGVAPLLRAPVGRQDLRPRARTGLLRCGPDRSRDHC